MSLEDLKREAAALSPDQRRQLLSSLATLNSTAEEEETRQLAESRNEPDDRRWLTPEEFKKASRSASRAARAVKRRLLVFAAVIALLAAGGLWWRSRNSSISCGSTTTVAHLQTLSVALESYRKLAGFYPTEEQGLQALVTKPDVPPVPERWTRILQTVPSDPWKRPYGYKVLGVRGEKYETFSLGPDGVRSNDDTVFTSGEN